MNRRELIAAALAAAGENTTFLPVQVQKLFFLIDREVSAQVGGPHFRFTPYDYGPFDSSVYDELDRMQLLGHVKIDTTGRYRRYSLTPEGFAAGRAALQGLTPDIQKFLSDVATWIRQLNFQQLVAAIYNRYPEMKVNSVFRE